MILPKIDVKVCFKDVEEPEEFFNISEFEPSKHGKFLYLYADIGTGLEWYIPLENVNWFEIEYKGGEK